MYLNRSCRDLCRSVNFRLCLYYFSEIYHLYFLEVDSFFWYPLFSKFAKKAVFFSLHSIHSAFDLRSMPLIWVSSYLFSFNNLCLSFSLFGLLFKSSSILDMFDFNVFSSLSFWRFRLDAYFNDCLRMVPLINSHNVLVFESEWFRTSYWIAFLMMLLKSSSNKYDLFMLKDPGPLGSVDRSSFSFTKEWSDLYPGIILHCKACVVINKLKTYKKLYWSVWYSWTCKLKS